MKSPGAHYDRRSGRCSFTVWAPLLRSLEVKILFPQQQLVPMERDEGGYWHAAVGDARPGTRYFFRLDKNRDRPDPASRFQPTGVHGPSEVVDHNAFRWTDGGWKGLLLRNYAIYELHVGAFTPEGTFDVVVPRLDALRDLGVTAIELMPVAQFPGNRNWGYDGAYPFAVQDSYGGPEGLKRLVDACHRRGLAVVLDVVYNHLGPEGNYLWDFGPYFTDRYRTPWGQAINYDGPYSDDVRHYVIENARAWHRDYHIDALRLDAIHGIFDFSARHILQDIGDAVHGLGRERKRRYHVLPESDLNDSRVIRPREQGGYGLDGQWNDDFHHALRTLLTGEQRGYYEDFGRIEDLVTAFGEGFVYSGRYSAFRRRRHGNRSDDLPPEGFVVFSQNHDQVGNRMLGDRLSAQIDGESLKLAAACVILSPYLPLLFMGEEYGEDAPFQYFVSHGDRDLIEAVRKGRKEEFRHFNWEGEPPDPQDEETFRRSRLTWEKRMTNRGGTLVAYYRQLLSLRRRHPALADLSRERCSVRGSEQERTIVVTRRSKKGRTAVCAFNFSDEERRVSLALAGPGRRLLDSADGTWGGPGSLAPETTGPRSRVVLRPKSAVLYGGRSGRGR